MLLMLIVLTASAQSRRELHILSINDPHAAIECMPRLGYVADSLRALYPDLLILSAGDNRSGDPINDMNEIPAYPMVALMNQIGFHATAVGNHEFDSGQEGLARLVNLGTWYHRSRFYGNTRESPQTIRGHCLHGSAKDHPKISVPA